MINVLFFISMVFFVYVMLMYLKDMIMLQMDSTFIGLFIFILSIFLAFTLYFCYPFEPSIPNIFTVIASIFSVLVGFYFLHRLKNK